MKTIKIVGQEVVESESEAKTAAEFILEWDGSSEADRNPLQVEVSPEWDSENEKETGRFEVRECWGDKANRDYGNGDVIATCDTEAEAEDHAAKHNAAALEEIMSGVEFDLPFEIDSIYFGGCERGKYPQSRRATITASINGADLEVTGFGSVQFIRDVFCFAALKEAAVKLVNAMALVKKEGRKAFLNELFSGMDRRDFARIYLASRS